MTNTKNTYVLYEDDGPLGICGQSMDITIPWRKLIRVAGVDEAYTLMRMSSEELSIHLSLCGVNGSKGREKARIVDWFSDDYDDRVLYGAHDIIQGKQDDA
jgi:hypothetical protein